jgi:hypothetical protein
MDLENKKIASLTSAYVKDMEVRGDFSRIDERESEE